MQTIPSLIIRLITIGLTLAVSVMVTSQFAHAKVYKWVDENGKVHYSDKPFENQNAEELKIKTEKSAKDNQTANQSNIEDIKRRVQAAQEAREDAKQAELAEEKKQQKTQLACETLKKQLQMLEQPIRIAQSDDNGEMQFLTDEQRTESINQIKQAMEQHCNN